MASSHHAQGNGVAGDTGSEDSNEAPGPPSVSQGDVFSRLVDPSNFTGIHRRRTVEEPSGVLPPPPPTSTGTIAIVSSQHSSLRRRSPADMISTFSVPKPATAVDDARTRSSKSYDALSVSDIISGTSQTQVLDENTLVANRSQSFDHTLTAHHSSEWTGEHEDSVKKGIGVKDEVPPLEEVDQRVSLDSNGEVVTVSNPARRSIKHPPNGPPPDYLTF